MTRISARELAGTSGPFGRGTPVVRRAEVPEGSVVTVLRVPPESAGMRLDRFVQTQLKRTSRTRAAEIVARGAYSPEARRLRGSDRVRPEQCIPDRARWRTSSTTARENRENRRAFTPSHRPRAASG
ncbi:hypothetical protein [Sorangium sp. So ce117]|uniref:hypothetical protein n=1 Tax=Sorangium sp. So ce117 TaxID=3133277 RepID=UPI003F626400